MVPVRLKVNQGQDYPRLAAKIKSLFSEAYEPVSPRAHKLCAGVLVLDCLEDALQQELRQLQCDHDMEEASRVLAAHKVPLVDIAEAAADEPHAAALDALV